VGLTDPAADNVPDGASDRSFSRAIHTAAITQIEHHNIEGRRYDECSLAATKRKC